MSLKLDQLPKELRELLAPVLREKGRLEVENKLLRETIRLMLLEKYGPRSEKLSDAQLQLLEEEPSVESSELDEANGGKPPEDKRPPKRKPNANHPGRVPFPEHLPEREDVIPCNAQEMICDECGDEKKLIRYEITKELDVIAPEYFVHVIKREVCACARCQEGVVTAPLPAKILPKSKLSDQFIIDAVVKKYWVHTPIYRQCEILEREAGITLSRSTLVDAVMTVGDLLVAVRDAIKSDLIKQSYIQADETTMPCQSERTRGRNHQAYMWQYSRPGGPVVFDFRMSRAREGPKQFLAQFSGKLQCDGYGAYDKLNPNIEYFGCWAHARRGFFEAHKLAPKDPVPKEIVELIGELYGVEKQAREEKLDFAARQRLRDQKSRPLVENLKNRVLEIQQDPGLRPGSKLAEACKYLINQWNRLVKYLDDGEIEIDNNWCENGMRGQALGRRNWLHIGSEAAGPKIAAIASVMETCRRIKINAREYLADVLPKLGDWPANRGVNELTPMAWKAAQTA